MKNGEHDEMLPYNKVRESPHLLRIQYSQVNLIADITLERLKVVAVHRILTMNDLMSV